MHFVYPRRVLKSLACVLMCCVQVRKLGPVLPPVVAVAWDMDGRQVSNSHNQNLHLKNHRVYIICFLI